MDPLTLVVFIAFILLTAGFGLVFAKLIARDRISAPADSWEAILSPTRYQVMERLLEEADQKMVEALGDPNLQSKFRKVRIKILRGYMQQLSQDFNSLTKAVRLMIVQAHADRRDLAGTLMRQQMLFAFGMMSLEFKLMLSELGFHTLGASGITASIDGLRGQLQSLAAMAQPSAA